MQTNLRGRDLINLQEWTQEEVETVLDVAFELKRQRALGQPALEHQLGLALFRRHHRELRLTEEGQTLYKTAGEVLRMLRDVTGKLGARSSGMLTVTTTVSFAATPFSITSRTSGAPA